MAESQASTALDERFFDDPSQLSQLLRQRAGSDRAHQFTTSTDSHPSGGAASIATFAIPPPLHAIHAIDGQLPVVPSPRRRVAPAGNVGHAKLSTHHSAPTESGFVKETDCAIKMHSFSGMHAPGDTQPDSQIYRQWTSGVFSADEPALLSKSKMTSPKSLFTEHLDEDGDSPSDSVDFVESSQEQQSLRVTSPTVIHDDDLLGPPAHSIYAPTSPLKFETPAVAGRKRDSSGLMLSSAVRTNTTPGTVESVAAFPGFGGVSIAPMSLTQAWQNTQAPTSPVVHDASEDMAFTRPSPNFTHTRQSSPIPALSSPIKDTQQDDHPRSDPVLRSSSEPRAEYVSMKESQERRRRTSGERPPRLLEEDSWEQPSAAQLRVQKKKLKEQWNRTTAESFAHISAPRPLSPGSGKKRSATVGAFSPTKSNSERHLTALQHDGASETTGEALTTNELSPDGPFTARTARDHNSKNNSVQVPKTSSHPTRTQSDQPPRNSSRPASPSSQLARRSQPQATASQPNPVGSLRPHSSRDSVAIMDSQPEMTANNDIIPRPKSIRFPSSPSVNQYSINQTTMATKTGYTSQVIPSSTIPPPPVSSQDEPDTNRAKEVTVEGEEGVPSSPPITAIDDEVTYDEHVYDEYAAEAEVRDSVEPEVSNEDGFNEGDDLPAAKSEPDKDGTVARDDDEEDDELDLIQPHKVDLSTDQEVSETLERDAPLDAASEEHGSMRPPGSGHGEASEHISARPVRIQRQDTIPETDALEETQPSLFPEDDLAAHNDPTSQTGQDAPNDTNSNEPFHTAREQLSGSKEHKPPMSSRDNESDTLQATERILTLQDIQNMPDTQQTSAEDYQMPRLSGVDEDEDFMAATSPVAPPAKRRKVTYTAKHGANRSPQKPTETLKPKGASSPPAQQDSSPTASAQEREVRGATAASNAREEAEGLNLRQATLKSRPMPRFSRDQTKSGSLKSVSRDLIESIRSSPLRNESPTAGRTSTPVTPTKRSKPSRRADDDVEMPNAADERDELADSTPEPSEPAVQPAADSGEQLSGDIIVPNRVFASWPGSHFYPARCLGRLAGQQLRVRFDDDNDTKLDASQVRALDLQPGDQVKVDETGRKKHTYIVVGFKDKIEDPDAPDLPTTDRHGYATVVLEEKRRDSLPAAKAAKPAELITAPMSSIYITTQLWNRLRGRSFDFSPANSPSKSASRIGTPVQSDALVTPSFSRRGTTAPSLLKGATARAASVTSTTRSGSGVFANMAFVLTSTGTNVDKDEISRTIKTNGGLVLEQGFHELFDPESSDAPVSSQSRRRSDTEIGGTTGLTLKSAYKDLGFVALVSDSHSRSTKYIQALALNVPCLHLRWVQDSLQASRAAPFLKYLLPAGVSKFLDPNGVVRSRAMTAYDPAAEDLTFDETVSNRDLLLQDQTVLLVTGKSKKEIEKRQPFIFLTHALGSAHVGRCTDLDAAADLLNDGEWDWVYVDNGEAGVADAAAELFGTGKPAASSKSKKGKKRKRDDTEEKEELVARGEVSGKKVKITCSEFVIQSLILGALIEE